ncbi:S1 RNA-binding domain-containing protein [Streptomyces sp. NPDC012421]|uniref:S1 RNA-binding domain-containing protein n=1 Tax=unclassified Streptomyces TaxID=2593676 RepID=UPI00368FEB32
MAEVTGRGVSVNLDGFTARPLGCVGPLDLSWVRFAAATVEVGDRVTAEVTAVDLERGQVRMSMAATENPELWAFLKTLRAGAKLWGRVASIERFGVFVALDDGPDHPVFPGVGFLTIPELSWSPFEDPSEVVQVGQRVECEFLHFDTTNGEARLSLRALRPDPFQSFAATTAVGETLKGRVTRLLPFGVCVRITSDIEGLVHLSELYWKPAEDPEADVRVGDEITVVVTAIDRVRRTLALSRRWAMPRPE